MKRQAFILIAAAILATTLYFSPGSGSAEIANHPSPNSGIVAFGDSLVEGVGSSQEGGFVSLLSQELEVPITNLGRSGDTTATALSRVGAVTQRKPALTLILLGGNDFLQGVARERSIENLGRLITAIQASGSAVLLIGLDAGIFGESDGKLFENLAVKYRTAYVADIIDGIYGNRSLMSDGLHPNDAGYRIMAKRVKPVLEELIRYETQPI